MLVAGLATSYIVFEGHEARPAFMFFYLSAFMFGVFTLDSRKLIGLGRDPTSCCLSYF